MILFWSLNQLILTNQPMSLNKNEVNLMVGEIDTLITTVTPTDASNKAVTWTSLNPEIATVDNTGKVTAISAGTVTITVSTADGNKTGSYIYTITK